MDERESEAEKQVTSECRPGPLPGDLLDNGLAWIEVCDGKRRAKGNGIHLRVSR